MTRKQPSHVPTSTYRLQFNSKFTFRDAAAIAAYLHTLGIGAAYTSPILSARPGSEHGYDVTDLSQLNPDLGSGEDFEAFAGRLKDLGMGLILDVVPNHMCIDPSNAWWRDVLENGPSSPYATYFDIDWNPPKAELVNKVLLPILGDQYGRVLENQELRVEYDAGAFRVSYWETRLPLAPRSWLVILEPVVSALRGSLGAEHAAVLELESILTALSYLPGQTEMDEERIRERLREKQIVKRRLSELVESSPEVLAEIEEQLRRTNGTWGELRSFDQLERLLAQQAYRLSYWRVAADEINYRRFFDVNDMAAVRMELPEVFAAAHARLLDCVRSGQVTGFRIDHPDGLFDPANYFENLQNACRATGAINSHPFFIVAEKIVTGDEELRAWPVEGTTGYGFLNFVNGLFVRRSSQPVFERMYRSLTGWPSSYEDLVYDTKRLILQVSLSSELNVLARRLDRISEQHRWSRDFTLESLRSALREVVTCFPIYRTYVAGNAADVDPEDERHIRAAVLEAKRRNPAVSGSVFDFIERVLLLHSPEGITEEDRSERRMFVMRLQQFTGSVMAKSVEDTAFYRFFPLVSLNEVGGDPRRFGTAPRLFHQKNQVRLKLWPNALLATSTHDTKRDEDVRARLNALSEIPVEWFRAVRSWRHMNRSRKTAVAGREAPSINDEYLLYQTLAGSWPLMPMSEAEYGEYVERIRRYMEKAIREAKVHTSWINPNTAYEDALNGFIASVLDRSTVNPFLSDFERLLQKITYAGMWNSLSQTLLKITSPGVPDFYQGSELWNLSLVDPDNRRPVDFAARSAMLEKLDREADRGLAALCDKLMAAPCDGAIKLFVTSRALRFRRANPQLFTAGEYAPLHAAGERREHVVAFARTSSGRSAITVASRFFLGLGGRLQAPVGSAWKDVNLPLPKRLSPGRYRDVFTGTIHTAQPHGAGASLSVADVLSHLPVSLLESVE